VAIYWGHEKNCDLRSRPCRSSSGISFFFISGAKFMISTILSCALRAPVLRHITRPVGLVPTRHTRVTPHLPTIPMLRPANLVQTRFQHTQGQKPSLEQLEERVSALERFKGWLMVAFALYYALDLGFKSYVTYEDWQEEKRKGSGSTL